MASYNCTLHLLAEEHGGRSFPIHSGFVGHFLLGDGVDLEKLEAEGSFFLDEEQMAALVTGTVQFENTTPLKPGEQRSCRLEFDDVVKKQLKEAPADVPFFLLEEDRIVASGHLQNTSTTTQKIVDKMPGSTSDFRDRLRNFGLEIAAFFSSLLFLKNFAMMVGTVTGLLLLTFWWMQCYTNHGESLQVEDYTGLSIEEATRAARSRSFRIEVSDSVFIPRERPNLVIEQDPAPLSRVKKNRTIYLTITKSEGDMVSLPSLVGVYDYDQYAKKLRMMDMEPRIRERQVNNQYTENTILHFYYNDQKVTEEDVRRGFKVPKGSTLEFVVTERGTTQVGIPNLVCREYRAAEFLLNSLELTVGTVNADATVTDRASAFVYRQVPGYQPNTPVRVGQQIDLYLTQSRPEGCPVEDDGFETLDESPFQEDEPSGGEGF